MPSTVAGAIGVPGSPGEPGASGGRGTDAGESDLQRDYEWLTARGLERVRPAEGVLSALADRGIVSDWKVFPAFGVIAVRGRREAADLLAAAPGVIGVQAVRQHRLAPSLLLTEPNLAVRHLRETRADLAWREFGAMGEGTTVAVIDTGAEWLHPLLRAGYRGRDGRHDHDWADLVDTPARSAPTDRNGHGTAVLSLIAGRGQNLATGVSPAVEWIAVRAFDDRGFSTDLMLLEAAQWVLAPTDLAGGDARPELAPDVVNGSWVMDNGADPLLADIVAAWEAAGIVSVFAAGNVATVAEAPAGILAPATYPQVLAVGALDENGQPWDLSARGPGFYGGVKPDLTAPGVRVTVAQLEGETGYGTGTSMAAPQVAGAACLLESLSPGLAPRDVRNFLSAAARDLDPPGSDAASGWGLLDVAAAAALAADAGYVAGETSDAVTSRPLQALIAARAADPIARPDHPWWTCADSQGRYRLALPAGRWQLDVTAFGHEPASRIHTVIGGQVTVYDPRLAGSAHGYVAGRVLDELGRGISGARVSVADQSEPIVDSGVDGEYVLQVPAGRQTVRYRAVGTRDTARTVEVAAGQTTAVTQTLEPAPAILLVDADAGSGERIHPYLTRALADAGYEHDTWQSETAMNLPRTADLAPYDVVLWSHTYGSPGSPVGGGVTDEIMERLAAYAAGGGGLVVSGQDVGTDGAQHARAAARAFYRDLLGARLVWPITVQRRLVGTGPFDGLSMELEWPTAHAKGRRLAPDVIEAVAEAGGASILTYPDGTAAGVAVDDREGRRLYLAFGPEGAGDRSSLAEMYDRAIAWLQSPRAELRVTPDRMSPGEPAQVSLVVHGHRTDRLATARIQAPGSITLEPGQGAVADGPSALTWTGQLEAGRPTVLHMSAVLTGPVRGGLPLDITATVVAGGRPITTTSRVWALAPDVEVVGARFEPERLPAGGSTTLEVAVANGGSTVADGVVTLVRLPDDLVPDSEGPLFSAGGVTWVSPRELVWTARLAPSDRVTLSLSGRLPGGKGMPHEALIVAADGRGNESRVRAWALVGGPDLAASTASVSRPAAWPGEIVTASVRLANTGLVAALVRLSGELPDGLALVDAGEAGPGTVVRQVPVAETAVVQSTIALRVEASASPGARRLELVLDDGARPAKPISRTVAIEVRPQALRGSAAWLLPGETRSGDWVTGTVLLANLATEPLTVDVVDSLPPALVLDRNRVAASAGEFDAGVPGTIHWHVGIAPPLAEIEWSIGRAEAIGNGLLLPESGEAGLFGPVDLGFAFPFVTEVFTRAWATDTGLLRFLPPPRAGVEGPGELDPATISAGWDPAAWHPSRPLLRRDASGAMLYWPAGSGVGARGVRLSPSGQVTLLYGSDVPPRPGAAGARAPDGREWRLPSPPAGDSAWTLPTPGGWARLDFRAQVGAGVLPNTRIEHVAIARTPFSESRLSGTQGANRLRLTGLGLDGRPTAPVAGGTVRYELKMPADGVVDARNVEARIALPSAAELVVGSESEGLTAGDSDGELVWRGRIAAGGSATATWVVSVPASLRPGARLATVASVRAQGVESFRVEHAVRVAAADLTGTRKSADRTVAWPGDAVKFRLRAANSGPTAVDLDLRDSLPAGLEYVPGSAWAAAGPVPEWRSDARVLTWRCPVPAQSAVELGLTAIYRGPGRQTNLMVVSDGEGTSWSAWADVVAGRDRAYLPWTGRSVHGYDRVRP